MQRNACCLFVVIINVISLVLIKMHYACNRLLLVVAEPKMVNSSGGDIESNYN